MALRGLSCPARGVGGRQAGIRDCRRAAVQRAIMHTWTAYRDQAWGYDDLKVHPETPFQHAGPSL